MMLNKFPANTSLQSILNYLETSTKWGARNRAQFALRQQLRIKDISGLQVADMLGHHGVIRGHYIAEDGITYLLDEQLRAELHRYLISRFQLQGDSLRPSSTPTLMCPCSQHRSESDSATTHWHNTSA